ncbi:hypothetical protein RZS08_12975, partial [Arthrospira platensis SPKY1]|nr:hypothetical protein [Arthrospira platensis SPKY1]
MIAAPRSFGSRSSDPQIPPIAGEQRPTTVVQGHDSPAQWFPGPIRQPGRRGVVPGPALDHRGQYRLAAGLGHFQPVVGRGGGFPPGEFQRSGRRGRLFAGSQQDRRRIPCPAPDEVADLRQRETGHAAGAGHQTAAGVGTAVAVVAGFDPQQDAMQ